MSDIPAPYTPEPWPECHDDPTAPDLEWQGNYARARDCVNACAGLPDIELCGAMEQGGIKAVMNRLCADNERLREALRGLRDKADSLFTLATDSIVNTGDGWACKSCGMELDTGGTHKADCCASAILDLNHVLHAADGALSATESKSTTP